MITFLLTAIAISLSGVLAPGPITAATLAAGARRPHAGAMVALGHAAVEFPLTLLILAGAGKFFQLDGVRIGIGLAGGVFLLIMGTQLLVAARRAVGQTEVADTRHPFMTGVVLTAANPYFLIWWATVGLALATEAVEFGLLAFALFVAVHWLCDLAWLEVLSLASYKGTELLGGRLERIVLVVSGLMLVGFGCKFVYSAEWDLLQ